MSVFDLNLMFRQASDGELNSDSTLTFSGIRIRGTPHRGMGLRVSIPNDASGTSPTMTIAVQAAPNDVASDYYTIAQGPVVGADITAVARDVIVPFATKEPWVRCVLTLGGTTATFGAVEIGIVHVDNGRGIDRTVNWA